MHYGVLPFTIGPKQKLAKIETSKAFARDLIKHAIRFAVIVFSRSEWRIGILIELGEGNYVVKAVD